MRRLVALFVLVLLPVASVVAGDEPKPKAKTGTEAAAPELTKAEQAFQEQLTNVTLVGSFTIVGRENGQPPKEERYEIRSVKKLKDDYWVFLARAKWGGNDVTLPFTVKVLWAGDTPMISLSNVGIPGLTGKFSTRVLFHGDWYAGTWKHNDVGGHMFGVVQKNGDGDTKDSSEKGEKKGAK